MLEPLSSMTVCRATQPDAAVLFDLICALADYEQLFHEVVGSEVALADHLFGDRPCIDALIAHDDTQALGFALFFPVMTLCATAPGIYLEDLFVQPSYRRQGIGKMLLSHLAQQAMAEQLGYLEWSVLDWNEPAIAFYRRIGASISDDQRICRVAPSQVDLTANQDHSVFVRDLRPDDWSQVMTLRAIADTHPSGADGSSSITLPSQPLASGIVVAEHQQRIIGCASFSQSYSTFLTRPGLIVTTLEVHPDYSRSDVGHAVLIYLAAVARDRHYGRLEWRVSIADETAVAQAHHMGATLLDTWRICHVPVEAIATLASI